MKYILILPINISIILFVLVLILISESLSLIWNFRLIDINSEWSVRKSMYEIKTIPIRDMMNRVIIFN